MNIYKVKKEKKFINREFIPKLNNFSSASTNEPIQDVCFQAFHDNSSIFFRFSVICPNPKIYVENNNKMEVLNSERVEIFFRLDSKMTPYYCLEIDASGRVLDYKSVYYRERDFEWKWPDSLEIEAKTNNNGYSIQGKFKISTLKKLDLIKHNEIQIGLFRGHCTEIIDSKASFEWITWINPKKEKPDFHIPEVFGLFVLED